MVQEICPCVISSRATFFSYGKLGWIRTMFYSVRETWSHVIEMLRRYWLEVRFVFFTIFRSWLLLVVLYFFVFLAILLIIDCYPEKIKFEILYRLCHRPCFSYEKLGCDLYTNFLYQVSRTSFSRNLDRLPSALGVCGPNNNTHIVPSYHKVRWQRSQITEDTVTHGVGSTQIGGLICMLMLRD